MIIYKVSGKEYADVIRDVNFHRYRERMHLSYADALQEPSEAVERAFVIWSLESARAKLDIEESKIEAQQHPT